MSRPGKGRMVPSSEEDDAATQITGEESRRLNGVNRQLQPDAAAQRLAASQSAAIKRKADAMPEDERKRKDAERNRLNRKKKAAEKAAAAATARESAAAEAAAADATAASSTATMPTLQTFNGWSAQHCGETIDEDEWNAFDEFCIFSELHSDDCSELPFIELFSDWRSSDEYQRYQMDLQPEQDAFEEPPPLQPSTTLQPSTASQPKCVECRNTKCICAPGAPDDDDPYQNQGAWANDMVGPSGWQDSPCSPQRDISEDDYWDNLIDQEIERGGAQGWR